MSPRTEWWAYAWWVLVGALLGVGAIALLTVGLAFLAVAAVLTALAAVSSGLFNRSALGVIGGLAAAPLYLAWLNRGGPGRVCTVDAATTSCLDAWSPWPFAAAGLVLVVACGVMIRATRRPDRQPPSRAGQPPSVSSR